MARPGASGVGSARKNTPIVARKNLGFVAVAPQTGQEAAKGGGRQAWPIATQRPPPGLTAFRGAVTRPGESGVGSARKNTHVVARKNLNCMAEATQMA